MLTLSLQKLCHGVRVNARRLEQGVDINILVRSVLSHRLTGEQWPKGHCARNEPRVCATADGKALCFCARILCVRLLEGLDKGRIGVDVVWRAVMHNRELDLGPQQLLDELVGDLFACDRDGIPDVDDRGAVVMVDLQGAQVEREDTRDLIRKVDAHTMPGPLGTDLACKELQGLVVFETVHGVQHLQQLADGVEALLRSRRMRWHAFHGELQLAVEGMPAHASTPEKGLNAIGKLLQVLDAVHCLEDDESLQFLAREVGIEWTGHRVGVDFADEVSGVLTLNLGTLHIDHDNSTAVINIRYPITVTSKQVTDQFVEKLLGTKIEFTVMHDSPPHYVDPATPLIQTLQKAYTEYTGAEAKCFSIGGGTYARLIPGAVAFGPLFPGQPMTEHAPDEYIDVDSLLKATRIYAYAMAELLKG